MKKLAIIAILASAATMASAAEIGVTGGRNFGSDQTYVGVSLGQHYGLYGLTAAYDHASHNVNKTTRSWDRYSLTGSRDLVKVGHHTVIAGKVGVAYVDPGKGPSGVAGTVGVGTWHPITDKLSFVTDLAYQKGQSKIDQYNGAQLSAGLRYSF